MKKRLENQKNIIFRILLTIVLILLIFTLIFSVKTNINGIIGEYLAEEENEKILSYKIYQIKKDYCKIMITATATNGKGLDYIICPNGLKFNCNGREKIALDYQINFDENYQFYIKQINESQLAEDICIKKTWSDGISIVSVSGSEYTNVDATLLLRYNSLINSVTIYKDNTAIYENYYQNADEVEITNNMLTNQEYEIKITTNDSVIYEVFKLHVSNSEDVYIAEEDQSVALDDGFWYIKYGKNSSFNYRWLAGSFTADNNTFGDPCIGIVKSAYKSRKLELEIISLSI